MKTYEPISFDDDAPIEIPVTVGSTEYILREADGEAAVRFRNAQMACIKMHNGKAAGVNGMADSEPLLVSLCLFHSDGSTRVNISKIRTWKYRIIKSLFEKAKEISDLTEEEQSLDQLRKQRDELNQRIKEIEEGDGESEAGNGQTVLTGGSV